MRDGQVHGKGEHDAAVSMSAKGGAAEVVQAGMVALVSMLMMSSISISGICVIQVRDGWGQHCKRVQGKGRFRGMGSADGGRGRCWWETSPLMTSWVMDGWPVRKSQSSEELCDFL